jgi:hypothetical protein
MLIRIESSIHLIKTDDSNTWQHYEIEKNIVSINGQIVPYVYNPPPIEKFEDGIDWTTIVFSVGVASIIVMIVFMGKRARAAEKNANLPPPMQKE